MNKWDIVGIDWTDSCIVRPDLVTARCPYCKRYHTTIFWGGEPMYDQIFCPRCGKKVVDDEAKLKNKEVSENV